MITKTCFKPSYFAKDSFSETRGALFIPYSTYFIVLFYTVFMHVPKYICVMVMAICCNNCRDKCHF